MVSLKEMKVEKRTGIEGLKEALEPTLGESAIGGGKNRLGKQSPGSGRSEGPQMGKDKGKERAALTLVSRRNRGELVGGWGRSRKLGEK